MSDCKLKPPVTLSFKLFSNAANKFCFKTSCLHVKLVQSVKIVNSKQGKDVSVRCINLQQGVSTQELTNPLIMCVCAEHCRALRVMSTNTFLLPCFLCIVYGDTTNIET